MGSTQEVMKKAVECGYWHLYRYNPLLEDEGKNPFILDSPEPKTEKFREFLMNETRYTSLIQEFPENADMLFRNAEENARWRYQSYRKIAGDPVKAGGASDE
jgi:pyruvate-ferredoxin/flavodoxin oxidoreductase